MPPRFIQSLSLIILAACATTGRDGTKVSGSGAAARFAGTFAGELSVGGYRNAVLVTVHEDGTMTSSDGNDFEGANRGQFNSPGYGAWRQTGERTTVFAVREFEYDSTGRLLGTSTIQGTGNYSAGGTDVTGNMMITTWRGQPGPAGLTYHLHRIDPERP